MTSVLFRSPLLPVKPFACLLPSPVKAQEKAQIDCGQILRLNHAQQSPIEPADFSVP
jgi:hypothetical protein